MRVRGRRDDTLYVVPFGFGDFVGQLGRAGDTGVVDYDVQTAEQRGDLIDCGLHVLFVGDIDVPVAGIDPAPVQFRGQRVAFGIQYVEHRDLRAFLAEALDTGTTDAQGAAGDDADFVFDAIHDVLLIQSGLIQSGLFKSGLSEADGRIARHVRRADVDVAQILGAKRRPIRSTANNTATGVVAASGNSIGSRNRSSSSEYTQETVAGFDVDQAAACGAVSQ